MSVQEESAGLPRALRGSCGAACGVGALRWAGVNEQEGSSDCFACLRCSLGAACGARACCGAAMHLQEEQSECFTACDAVDGFLSTREEALINEDGARSEVTDGS